MKYVVSLITLTLLQILCIQLQRASINFFGEVVKLQVFKFLAWWYRMPRFLHSLFQGHFLSINMLELIE
jgi:hypothetical protein